MKHQYWDSLLNSRICCCHLLYFSPGNYVIDIGGNVGIVSIYLAKEYPFLKIYAFEPMHCNYENFKENIKLNNIPEWVITLVNKAVTKDGRSVVISYNLANSGGSIVSDKLKNNSHDYRQCDEKIDS